MRKLLVAGVLALSVALAVWLGFGAVAGARQPSAPSRTSNATTQSVSSTESEDGADNEADGHEDPDGVDVNHECPPNCDTANGEVP